MNTIDPTRRKVDNWQEVLWQEWRHCNDSDYAKQLRRIPLAEFGGWIQSLGFNASPRPYATEVEAALRTACQVNGGVSFLWQKRLDRLDKAKKKSAPLPKLLARLDDHHWLERFIARHVLLYRGGEAVVSLAGVIQTGAPDLQDVAFWLLQSIGQETKERLADQANHLLCSDCVIHCHPLEIIVPNLASITYFGCRFCRQSRDFQRWPGGVVAVLDRCQRKEKVQRGDQIRVNWLVHQRLFDFERVEIIRATDEDIERFAVQVGNDTYENRSAGYKEMECAVQPDCRLTANTVRILEHIFGSVDVTE